MSTSARTNPRGMGLTPGLDASCDPCASLPAAVKAEAQDHGGEEEPAAAVGPNGHESVQVDLGRVKVELPAIIATSDNVHRSSIYIELSSSDDEDERAQPLASRQTPGGTGLMHLHPGAYASPAAMPAVSSNPAQLLTGRAMDQRVEMGDGFATIGSSPAEGASVGGTSRARVPNWAEPLASEKRRRLNSSSYVSSALHVKPECFGSGEGNAQAEPAAEAYLEEIANGHGVSQHHGGAGHMIHMADGMACAQGLMGKPSGQPGPSEGSELAARQEHSHAQERLLLAAPVETVPMNPGLPASVKPEPDGTFQSPPQPSPAGAGRPWALRYASPGLPVERLNFHSPGVTSHTADSPAAESNPPAQQAAVEGRVLPLQGSAQPPSPRPAHGAAPTDPVPGGREPEAAGGSRLTPLSAPAVRRQFWHAGDYDTGSRPPPPQQGGMDHVRVHPKFLHSNATSHKWALGALAELLDNAMDEVGHGASFCKVDMVPSPADGQPMLLVEDDGGGMSPDRLRACMSLGYSDKSKKANTVGQYGNGFKTSTMRLGADVIVFSRSPTGNGSWPTQSIGLLSFSFLRDTGLEDTVVPMIDYSWSWAGAVNKLVRSSEETWESNLATITQWSPYRSEEELLKEFESMGDHGTKVLVYNLWLTDDGNLELDFETDPEDIQVRGARDERHLKLAESGKYPNSHHFLTYRHSLRSYASILYLRRPRQFRIYLRGKEVEPHSIGDDLMYKEEVVYRPKGEDASGMMASVTIGFVKDAKEHIDVQGFCVYHKNRLIKPFWKLWNAASSQGRGVVGVLEANFVEPAHDKQGFEKTEVLRRLEERLLKAQKTYWSQKSTLVGYVPWMAKKVPGPPGAGGGQSAQPSIQPPGVPVGNGHVAAAASPLQATAAVAEPGEDVKPVIGALPERRGPGRPRRASDDPSYRPPGGAARLATALPAGPPVYAQPPAHDLEEGEIPRGEVLPWAIPLPAAVAPGGEEELLSQSQGERGLQQVVDSDWLSRLMEDNRDLRARCTELESVAEEMVAAGERIGALEQQVRALEAEREQEKSDRAILQEQHLLAERRLREQLKAAILRAQAAEGKSINQS